MAAFAATHIAKPSTLILPNASMLPIEARASLLFSIVQESTMCMPLSQSHGLIAARLQGKVCPHIQELIQTVALSCIASKMASGARQRLGAASTSSVATLLPPEILQHICSLLQDPDDLASFHLVDTRCARPVE